MKTMTRYKGIFYISSCSYYCIVANCERKQNWQKTGRKERVSRENRQQGKQ